MREKKEEKFGGSAADTGKAAFIDSTPQKSQKTKTPLSDTSARVRAPITKIDSPDYMAGGLPSEL
jgi:hypothetical protein